MQAGDEIELRGPITTTKISLAGLSEVDLVSRPYRIWYSSADVSV